MDENSDKSITNSTQQNVADNENDKTRKWSILSFIFVILIIGVPMWWKTTEVYRVTLPYAGIQSLKDVPIKVAGKIGIYCSNDERSLQLIKELIESFNTNDLLELSFFPVEDDSGQLKSALTPAELETNILRQIKLLPGDFLFIEWKRMTEDVLMTSERSALISSDTSSYKLKQIIENWLYQEYKLRTLLSVITENRIIEPNVKRQRSSSATPQPQYDVLISVLNPRPDIHNIQWNVRSAIDSYIRPFLEQINFVSNFNLKSQWKYQFPLEFPSNQIKDNSTLGRHYSLPEEYLPYIITSVEKMLGNPLSDNPCIHLVVYIPPCESSPLHIYNKYQQRVSPNDVESFISIKWGGIIIQNTDIDVCSKFVDNQQPIDIEIRSEQVMQILIEMLRKIIELDVDIPIERASIIPLDNVKPRQWEIDAYARTTIVHLVSSTTLTLQSLIQLLGGISNIVINDEVGIAVNDAYKHLEMAKQLLKANDLSNATYYAKKAFGESETAFFHPSILALLYFPDDQKYAIYIPLFLPIMIPVVLSLKALRKKSKDTKDVDKDDVDKNKKCD